MSVGTHFVYVPMTELHTYLVTGNRHYLYSVSKELLDKTFYIVLVQVCCCNILLKGIFHSHVLRVHACR